MDLELYVVAKQMVHRRELGQGIQLGQVEQLGQGRRMQEATPSELAPSESTPSELVSQASTPSESAPSEVLTEQLESN